MDNDKKRKKEEERREPRFNADAEHMETITEMIRHVIEAHSNDDVVLCNSLLSSLYTLIRPNMTAEKKKVYDGMDNPPSKSRNLNHVQIDNEKSNNKIFFRKLVDEAYSLGLIMTGKPAEDGGSDL